MSEPYFSSADYEEYDALMSRELENYEKGYDEDWDLNDFDNEDTQAAAALEGNNGRRS